MNASQSHPSAALHVAAHVLGAALLVNAVPHGVHGLSGQEFPTPFADPPGVGMSNPGLNVLWSSMNAVAGAALLLGVGRFRFGANVDTVAALAGGVLAAYGLSRQFAGVGTRS